LGEAGVIRTFKLTERNPTTTIAGLEEDMRRAAADMKKTAPAMGMPGAAPAVGSRLEDSTSDRDQELPPGAIRCRECRSPFFHVGRGRPPVRCPACRAAGSQP
jgi:hypothetical protein